MLYQHENTYKFMEVEFLLWEQEKLGVCLEYLVSCNFAESCGGYQKKWMTQDGRTTRLQITEDMKNTNDKTLAFGAAWC